ncbi:acetolactate synthase-1/2/3 large subunit [Nocardia sp. GAS34]|uniref:thiamine pyrophosphate-binding protein n=1 Tax=unclassified Nocardia TaxID=2637762 RepID=UPI003D1E9E9B
MFVHEVIAQEVGAAGADTMFGLIGDANMFMVNAFVEKQHGTYVSAVHEASSVMMAHGYACRGARLGVATVTQGPGLTNTATALTDCVRSSSPVLLITGDTAPSNRLNRQTFDQEPLVRATGAGYVLVTAPDEVRSAVRLAARRAMAESRPYVLNCPTEYQWHEVGSAADDEDPWSGPEKNLEISEDVPDEALSVIASARRPLVLAGHGVIGKEQRQAVLAFAERIGAPIATTLRARNLYSAAEGCVGVCGTVSTEPGMRAIGESDCIIAFGASLNTWTTVRNSLIAGKRVVHIDTNEAGFRREVPVTATVLGDAAVVAQQFIEALDAAGVPPTGFRDRVTAGVEQADLIWDTALGQRVTLAGVLSAMNRALPRNRTVVYDGGRFEGEAYKYIWGTDYRSQVLTTDFGVVGLGMGAAIGAAAAARDEPAVLVTGDGGFMMNGMAELHSAIRAGLPLIVVICNDSSYGAEYDQFVSRGLDPSLSLFDWPDFAEVARALGADGLTVDTVADVPAALAAFRSPTRPVVIDVRIGVADIPEVPH